MAAPAFRRLPRVRQPGKALTTQHAKDRGHWHVASHHRINHIGRHRLSGFPEAHDGRTALRVITRRDFVL